MIRRCSHRREHGQHWHGDNAAQKRQAATDPATCSAPAQQQDRKCAPTQGPGADEDVVALVRGWIPVRASSGVQAVEADASTLSRDAAIAVVANSWASCLQHHEGGESRSAPREKLRSHSNIQGRVSSTVQCIDTGSETRGPRYQ